MTAPKRPPIDWPAVERDYRAGLLSLRELGAMHSVSHVSIKKRADKEGWTKSLAEKIRAKADDLVNRAVANRAGNSKNAVSERQIIEANAERIAQVRGEHRAIGNRVGNLGLQLLSELEQQTASVEDLEALGELMRREDKAGQDRLNDLYRKIVSTPGRVESAKKVAETLKHAIAMEREAYGLDENNKAPNDGDILISF